MPGAEKGATRVDGRYVQGGFQAQGYGLKGAALTAESLARHEGGYTHEAVSSISCWRRGARVGARSDRGQPALHQGSGRHRLGQQPGGLVEGGRAGEHDVVGGLTLTGTANVTSQCFTRSGNPVQGVPKSSRSTSTSPVSSRVTAR